MKVSLEDKDAYNLVIALGNTRSENGKKKEYDELVHERKQALKLILELQNKVTGQAIAYQNLMSKHRRLLKEKSKRTTFVGYLKGLWRDS